MDRRLDRRLDPRTVRLVALFLVLAGAYVVLEVVVAPRRERARRLEERIFPFEAAEVAQIALASGARVAVDSAGPRLREPVDAPADPQAVGALVDRLVAARWGRRFDVAAESLAAYGLDPPQGTATVSARDGRSVTLAFGAETPAGKSRYYRDAASGRVGVTGNGLARVMAESAEALRDRRLVVPSAAALWSARLERPRGALALAREGPGMWRIVEPISARASRDQVATLLARIVGARAARFLDAAGDSAPPAPAAPLPYRVILHGDGFEDTLAFGSLSTEDSSLVAIAPLQPGPVLVDASLREILDLDAASLREEHLFRRAPAEAAAISLSLGEDALALERRAAAAGAAGEGAWRIVAPESLDADPTRVRALLRNLDIVRIARWADDTAAGAAGLDPPRARVTLRFADPPSSETLALGLPTPDGDLFAAWEGEAEIFAVPGALLDVVTPDPAAFETRRVLAEPLAAAHEIRVWAAVQYGVRVRLERTKSGWTVRDGTLAPDTLRALTERLAALEWVDRFVRARRLGDLPSHSPPILTVEWDGPRARGIEIRESLDPTRRFGDIAGRNAAYLFDAAEIDSICALLGALDRPAGGARGSP